MLQAIAANAAPSAYRHLEAKPSMCSHQGLESGWLWQVAIRVVEDKEIGTERLFIALADRS